MAGQRANVPGDGQASRHLAELGTARGAPGRPRWSPLGASRGAEHDLQPHSVRTFKRSNDPAFADKLRDIVGLYVDPPAHSLVLSVDEKSHVWMAPGLQEKFAVWRSLSCLQSCVRPVLQSWHDRWPRWVPRVGPHHLVGLDAPQ